ncbi:ABC transporter ATP-binding protein [Streptomyces sp. I6]|uniref:ABC transporter ATP-binding protein n=1 Tax=Streptomyces sp. I6 TaxID=2483113 RepID=UPI0028804B26|nr:ABC transporter ATP-binding protein [Streptomyces sp. I6]
MHALRPTDLVVRRGDYITVTGPSGSGKSTLLNLVGLLDRPDTGTCHVLGRDTAGLPEAERGALRAELFGFVFQAFHLVPGRSALENVELGMLYGPLPPARRRALAREAIERVRLAHRADADPRTLSGGERQRVALARAVAGAPVLLLCDEPTGNLDGANTRNILELLRRLHGTGMTLVVVTHDPDVARQGTRRLRVDDGTVAEED